MKDYESCEKYVLAELKSAQEEVSAARQYLSSLKESHAKEVKALKAEINKLKVCRDILVDHLAINHADAPSQDYIFCSSFSVWEDEALFPLLQTLLIESAVDAD